MLALPAMQRNATTPHLALATPVASLTLLLAEPFDPRVRAWLQQNVDALVEPLRPWGKFRQPVLLEPVADAAALAADLPQPSHLELRGVAALDRVRFVVPQNLDDLLPLLRHELGHVQCFQRCTPPHGRIPYLPTWFREGLALHVAHGRPEPQARRPLAAHPHLALLPNADDAQIARDPTAAYALAAHLFTAWHDRYGTLGLTGLYAALRQGHPFATAFQRSCQLRANEYIEAWLAAVRREAKSK